MLYNFGIIAYRCAIGVASLFNEKAALWVKGRKGIWKRMEAVERGKGRLVWFHAASLGEFEQGRPVIEKLKEMEPHTKILLTFSLLPGTRFARIIKGPIISIIYQLILLQMPVVSWKYGNRMLPCS